MEQMELAARDERIYVLRVKGASFAEIAKLFNITRERARQICLRVKDRKENFDSWPPLKKLLSNRTKNALNSHLKNESLMENPQKIVDLGRDEIRRTKNLGEKSRRELVLALRALGFITGSDTWL
jgi:hypothetical protein